MSDPLYDAAARRRFREEFETNFAVSANAGSGKTTAISERLAWMALSAEGAKLLPRMVVVTFTKKAAAQIRQRARATLLREIVQRRDDGQAAPPHTLELLDRAFFGTIHSFCLVLGQRFGATYGLNLNPTVLEEGDEVLWEEFVEQDPMQFTALPGEGLETFLRFVPLEDVFPVARELSAAAARRFLDQAPRAGPPPPDEQVLAALRALPAAGSGRKNIDATKRAVDDWVRRYHADRDFLPMLRPIGSAAAVTALVRQLVAPLKEWLAAAAAAVAGELALRYQDYRFERGVQTYADQVEAALAVLQHRETLDRIRTEGYRVLLDEAQDTDPQQFAVLVEIARPPGAGIGDWPDGGGRPPRPGHFSMVGDGQQAIYGSRADVRNFLRHLEAFGRHDGGEQLVFSTTFRAPEEVTAFCNAGFATAFGEGREHNFGVSPPRRLQVAYSPLVPAPGRGDGLVSRLPLTPGDPDQTVGSRLAEEVRQIARFLRAGGPPSVGARTWGEVCLLGPRNDWLATARKVMEDEGLKVALQMRRNRNGDHPVYAWLSGLLAVVCDPENAFEWVGVLREVFGIADALIAATWKAEEKFQWEEPGRHPAAIAAALGTLAPFILRADEEGTALEEFAAALIEACALRARSRLIDPTGGAEAELERLAARAARLGQDGGGPRQWLRDLLLFREEGRPAGKPTDDAINLLTAHSAKGLEWPVVIPFGLWRPLRSRPETGLRLLAGDEPGARMFFDSASVPPETDEARRRERLRELTRLLYVTFTRARRHLVIPWHPRFTPRAEGSFADLWGAVHLFDALPETASVITATGAEEETDAGRAGAPAQPSGAPSGRAEAGGESRAAPPLPARRLPHQLAHGLDAVRRLRHESMLDEPSAGILGEDAVDYGLWWHETMEYLPWESDGAGLEDYLAVALARARQMGFGPRAAGEIAQLRATDFLADLRRAETTRLTELAVFAPVDDHAWIDGVIDLVVHDPAARLVRVIDWKTNRLRPGETGEALLARLCEEYRPQLEAYGTCAGGFFPGCAVRLELYASAAGAARVLGPT
jgi:ATP-dependent exoDNAse (exonuclease V) beta subunit